MPSAEFSSTVASRLFTPSHALRRDAVYAGDAGAAGEQNTLSQIRRPDAASVHSYAALEAIAESNLNAQQKDALIKLTAQVDERERGNPSYLSDIVTLVKMLDAGADGSQREALSLEEATLRYEAERSYLSSNPSVDIAYSLSFSQFESRITSANSKSEQDFLRAANRQDMLHAFDLARQVLGQGVDIFA